MKFFLILFPDIYNTCAIEKLRMINEVHTVHSDTQLLLVGGPIKWTEEGLSTPKKHPHNNIEGVCLQAYITQLLQVAFHKVNIWCVVPKFVRVVRDILASYRQLEWYNFNDDTEHTDENLMTIMMMMKRM